MKKEQFLISFILTYKQHVNNGLSWSTLNFDYDVKLIEDGKNIKMVISFKLMVSIITKIKKINRLNRQ